MKICFLKEVGWDGSVGTATRYGLNGMGIEFRGEMIFLTRPDSPWVQPILQYNV
jgi:hypothetical protein